jgi:methyl-accepting chemotaxis protein
MSFKNAPIIVKVVSLLVLFGCLTGFAAVYAGSRMQTIDASHSQLLNHKARASQNLSRISTQIQALIVGILENTNAIDDAGNKAALDAQKVAFDEANRLFRNTEPLLSDHKAELHGFADSLAMVLQKTCAETIRLANAETNKSDSSKSQIEMRTVCRPAFKKLTDALRTFTPTINTETEKEADDLTATTNTTIIVTYAIVFGGLAVVMVIAVLAAIFGISGPVKKLNDIMSAMAAGKLDVTVTGTERRDEIGSMSRTVEGFRKSLLETERMRELTAQTEAKIADERRQSRNQFADLFQTKIGALANAFAKSSAEVSDAAKNLSATADETSRRAQAVSGAAEEASANVQTVAASTEEMSASIREIAGQVAKSSEIANAAANEASRTETDVRALSEAATKIGEVVDLINNIASQTNLLALNATIEAARAGEAGRGFAVVASEVKQLASQTARATEEIGSKINEIQQATDRTVGSIDKIVGTVAQIQQISTVIAAAIEEQGAATGEISSNTQLAARGTEDVTSNISGVGRAAEMTGSASTQLMGLAGNLDAQAGNLQKEVAEFVKQLRAG